MLVVGLPIHLGEGGIEGFGDGLASVIDRPADGEGGGAIPGFAGVSDFFAAGGFAGGIGDPDPFGVVFVGEFVLAHDGELDAVDGLKFVEGEAEGEGDEDVDFEQGLAAGEVAAQGGVPGPGGGVEGGPGGFVGE